jgi:8-oxo-dGTP pyrophosphatase MutT (NUDIX family)
MIRLEIQAMTSQIEPLDKEEAQHIAFVEKWIDSGAEIFRIAKPATPDPHLVAYFLLIDQNKQSLLLVEHRKANLWLPAGGHIEPNEHPKQTVCREIIEELGVKANFLSENPFFLTVTKTTGDKDKHTDVSFWYILKANIETPFRFCEKEFHSVRWFTPSEIPLHQSDPHMSRLVQKLILHNILPLKT